MPEAPEVLQPLLLGECHMLATCGEGRPKLLQWFRVQGSGIRDEGSGLGLAWVPFQGCLHDKALSICGRQGSSFCDKI